MSVDQLDDFDLTTRRRALESLASSASFPPPAPILNLHAHTFYSYNYRGFSPSRFAYEAKSQGLEMGGIVEFDCLDGLDEFLAAARLLNLKGCVGVESRVFAPEFADREINSPGEPGISYHMGVGFTSTDVPAEAQAFLDAMRRTSAERNRGLLGRVNGHLDPVVLDYDADVLPLTPAGNATERHLCLAYARKAAERFTDSADLARFWADKLGVSPEDVTDLPEGRGITDLLRAKTMKRGGVGYVQPDTGSFPKMADMNRFTLQCGAIPTLAWLDGFSAGEQAIEELVDVGMASGVAAVNVIPDRNYTPGSPDDKLKNLEQFVALAERRGLPLIGGTEMNGPGQKFVDDFDSAELDPLRPVFRKGGRILYAHTVLQGAASLGYLSDWAAASFTDLAAKNDFFSELGGLLEPRAEERFREALAPEPAPAEILDHARQALAAG